MTVDKNILIYIKMPPRKKKTPAPKKTKRRIAKATNA
jgi:hypothetical protein